MAISKKLQNCWILVKWFPDKTNAVAKSKLSRKISPFAFVIFSEDDHFRECPFKHRADKVKQHPMMVLVT